ncbi:PAAR domain-containing protein [Chloroflexota bacterium]
MKLHDCPKDKSLYLILIAIIPLIILAIFLPPAAIVWSDDVDDCAGCEGECTQLKEQCIEDCNKIKRTTDDLDLGYDARTAFGCHARACSYTFERAWCIVPGYLECAKTAIDKHLECNMNCVYEYKAAKEAGNSEEMKTIRENCRPKCNEEWNEDIFEDCRFKACDVWCAQKGYPESTYKYYGDRCECLGERVDEPTVADEEKKYGVIESEGRLDLISPPDGPLIINRDDLPEWARYQIAVVGAAVLCVGPTSKIMTGDKRVFIDGLPVARRGDITVTGGIIIQGSKHIFVNGFPVACIGDYVVEPRIIGIIPAVGGPIITNGS